MVREDAHSTPVEGVGCHGDTQLLRRADRLAFDTEAGSGRQAVGVVDAGADIAHVPAYDDVGYITARRCVMARRRGSSGNRTRRGTVTAAARRRHGGVKGRFPIFDSRSARSAIRLRGHAKTAAERRSVVNRAAKYAPAAAAKARKADSKH